MSKTNEQLIDEIDAIDGGSEFLRGYILAVGFTASDQDGENYFGAGSGEFTDYVGVDEIVDTIGAESMNELLTDVLDFLTQAHHLLVPCDMADAGANFHYTRNGHGVGFWDGDWDHGDELTEFAKTYGSFELYDGYMG